MLVVALSTVSWVLVTRERSLPSHCVIHDRGRVAKFCKFFGR